MGSGVGDQTSGRPVLRPRPRRRPGMSRPDQLTTPSGTSGSQQLRVDLAGLVVDGRPGSGEGRLLLPAVMGAEDQVEAAGQYSADEALRAAGATAGPAVRTAHDSGRVAAVGERQGSDGGRRENDVLVQGGSGQLDPPVERRSVQVTGGESPAHSALRGWARPAS